MFLKNNFFRNLKNFNRIKCFKFSSLSTNGFIKISDEIKFTKKPIVALESTIITHGLPYPANLETALEVEHEVRNNNAIPATIAFLNGKFQVGLNRDEIEFIAKNHEKAIKISRRDMSYILSKRNEMPIIGGTTVSATSICANEAKIPIFCTGGIGGVHRDFIDSIDVSADLQELARTPVAVVSSGVKSILDIEKTLEYLETMGVCVVTLEKNGSTDFPSFFTSKSGFNSPYNCINEHEVAKLIQTNLKTGFSAGLLIGVPIPHEYEADKNLIDQAIQEALIELKKLNIKGKKVTPFLLEKINKITKGKSLKSNIALIKNNAKTSAKIAIELQKLNTNVLDFSSFKENNHIKDQITVIGGTNLDYVYKLTDESTINLKGVTQPCDLTTSLGGVARNMSEALFRLGIKNSILISTVSDDFSGRYVIEESSKIGLNISKIHVLKEKDVLTGTYTAVFYESGEINLALGNMKAHDYITSKLVESNLDTLDKSEFCVIDADIPSETINYVSTYCQKNSIPIWFNPTDLRKCHKLIEANSLSKITYMSPNLKELFTIFGLTLKNDKNIELNEKRIYNKIYLKYKDSINKLENLHIDELKIVLKYLLRYVPFIVLTRGCDDLILASAYELNLNEKNQLPSRKNMKALKLKKNSPQLLFFPIVNLKQNEKISNVSGAGDSTSSGIIAGILKDYNLKEIIYNGLASAKCTVMSDKTVSEKLETLDIDQIKKLVVENELKIKNILL